MAKKKFFWAAPFMALSVFLFQCGDEDSDYLSRFSCDLFQHNLESVQLEAVLAVGRDLDNTIYVVDRTGDGAGINVFVSVGSALYRKELVATELELENDGSRRYWLTVREDALRYTLLVEIDAAGGARMAKVQGDYDGIIADIGYSDALLEVLDQTAIASMTLENFDSINHAEFLADTADGKSVLIARPSGNWDYDEVRLFFGSADKMIERPILKFFRDENMGTILVDFEIGDSGARVFFGSESVGLTDSYLIIDDQTTPITRLDAAAENMGRFSFYCSH